MPPFNMHRQRGLKFFRPHLQLISKSDRFFDRLKDIRVNGSTSDPLQDDDLLKHRVASSNDSEESVFDRFAKELEAAALPKKSLNSFPSGISTPTAPNSRTEPSIVVFDIAALRARYDKLENSEKSLRGILKKFDLSGDDGRRTLAAIPKNFGSQINDLKCRFPNCVEFLDFVGHFAHLARLRHGEPHLRFPPVLLAGPPGVGKTAVVREVAKLLDVQCRVLDIASTTAGFVLSGMSSSWSEAKTGCIVDLLRDGKTANPMLVLDEIDKASTSSKFNPIGALYTLLEPDAAKNFIDEALDMPCDASQLLVIATANDLGRISAPLLSRFVVLHIEAITSEHRATVIRSIYRAVLEHLCVVERFDADLADEVIETLTELSPRQTKIALMRSVAAAASRYRNPDDRVAIQNDDLVKPNDAQRDKPMGYIW